MMNRELPQGETSAVVLTGGKSSRMGRPKALLPFDGEPLIVHLVRNLRRLFDDIVVVAAPGQEIPPLPVTVVRDDVAYQGPVGGIYYGLKAARGEVAFVSSCDVPFLNLSLVSHLLSRIGDCDVVVPYWENRLQPLQAIYRRSVLPHLREQLERGELRPIFLYDKVGTRKLEEDEIRLFDPQGDSFLNMNTPEDYQLAIKRWQECRQRIELASASSPASNSISIPLSVTVELFGVARLRAKVSEVALDLQQAATLADVLLALSERLPVLVGPVIAADRNRLTRGYACNINGRDFVRNPSAKVHAGDRIFIFSADAGG